MVAGYWFGENCDDPENGVVSSCGGSEGILIALPRAWIIRVGGARTCGAKLRLSKWGQNIDSLTPFDSLSQPLYRLHDAVASFVWVTRSPPGAKKHACPTSASGKYSPNRRTGPR